MPNIGDVVWIPTATHEPVRTTCPDCLGTAKWHCILPCGEEFDVECPRCYHGGYEPSDGVVHESHRIVQGAAQATITGMEWILCDEKLRYSTTHGCGLTDEDLCQDEVSALERSMVKAREYRELEDAQMLKRASRMGRPRKRADGSRAANPSEFGGGTANYARQQVRAAIREANKWIAFAARHSTVIDLSKMIALEAEYHPYLDGPAEPIGLAMEAEDDAGTKERERERAIENAVAKEIDERREDE